MIVHLI